CNKKYPDKFWGFYCVNPLEGKCVLDKLENAKNKGFVPQVGTVPNNLVEDAIKSIRINFGDFIV
ncbi:hypothetical protein DW054_16715, partial [Dorea formicigenerans]